MTPSGALALFLLLAGVVLLLGMRSMSGLGPVRKWVAIGTRLALMLLLVLIVAGLRWKTHLKNLQVLVLQDVSQSAQQLAGYPGPTLSLSVEDFLRVAVGDRGKGDGDQIGVISFSESASIEIASGNKPKLDAKPIIYPGERTDLAQAIQYGLATFRPDMRHRLLLVSDGNHNAGSDLKTAVDAAVALGVPIDVMPLSYNVRNEVILDRVEVSRTWLRENEQATLRALLKSTNLLPVRGKLTFTQEGKELATREIVIPPAEITQASDGSRVIKPGQSVEELKLSPLAAAGVHRFEAVFSPELVLTPGTTDARGGDTILSNNSASAFVFVQGKRRILYVDNVLQGGDILQEKLAAENINVERIRVTEFPQDLVGLQNYDAVILANVPYGQGGLNDQQDRALAAYVDKTGGGLLMIGGPDSFGAGGWRGRKVEEVLPVDMDVPAERQIAKGALVLIMHACEIPQGTYWGTECAIAAIKTLSSRDEIGVISGTSGEWEFPLAEKGDGNKPITAVRRMLTGDMGDYAPCIDSALKALNKSDAKQKHIIIISDGDASLSKPGGRDLLAECRARQISISTVTAFPHTPGQVRPKIMNDMATQTLGTPYGPIENNPSALPQIFVKESRIVVRSLIQESDKEPYGMKWEAGADKIFKQSMPELPGVTGMVLTTKKNNVNVEMPLATGPKNDPIFAWRQAGLGKSAAFTSDAHNKWAAAWVAQPGGVYGKFWAQVVQSIVREAGSADFSVQVEPHGDWAEVIVSANRKSQGAINFLTMDGTVIDSEMQPHEVKIPQVGPGLYVGRFDTPKAGNYVVSIKHSGGGADTKAGMLLSGLAVSGSPELRDLQSNDAWLTEVAQRTGGRVLKPFDPASAHLFSRENLPDVSAPVPIWDLLLPWAVMLLVVDVAVRRIAWDYRSVREMAGAVAHRIREFTLSRKVESAPALEALRKIRDQAEARKPAAGSDAPPLSEAPPLATAKFDGKGVEGEITEVVGGATDKSVPAPPKKVEPKGGYTGSLLEAKRRAREAIREKEKE